MASPYGESALDKIQTQLDSRDAGAVNKTSPYSRGPGTLRYSSSKQLIIFTVVCMWAFVPLTLTFICLFRDFCYAEEPSGEGNGAGGLRHVYSVEVSRAIVPVGLLLALVQAPLTLIAAHVHILAASVAAFVLNVTACALLIVLSIGSFAFLARVPTLSSEKWGQISSAIQSRSYGGSQAAFERQMAGDVTAIALASLTGAVLTGLVCLMHYPMLYGQVVSFLVEYTQPLTHLEKVHKNRRLRTLCCSVGKTASSHDAAHGEAHATDVVMHWWKSVWARMLGRPMPPAPQTPQTPGQGSTQSTGTGTGSTPGAAGQVQMSATAGSSAGAQGSMTPPPPPAPGRPNPVAAAVSALCAPVTRCLSTPTREVRASFLTFVARTCGRPGLVLVSLCLIGENAGDRELLQRASQSGANLNQAAAGGTAPTPAGTGAVAATAPVGAISGAPRVPEPVPAPVASVQTITGSSSTSAAVPAADATASAQEESKTA